MALTPLGFSDIGDLTPYTPTANFGTPTNWSPYLSLMGGGMSAMASIGAGNADASLARSNASIAALQAQSAQQSGAQQAELYRQKLTQTLGRQQAQIGGAGITRSGSALRALSTTAQLGQQDISNIQLNAARKAWGFSVDQVGDQSRAKYDQAAGLSQGLGSLITSGARAYGMWSSD